ncbi:MAG: hypothetical protein ACN4GZ_03245, partial [Acidimicrobiales bacterium]
MKRPIGLYMNSDNPLQLSRCRTWLRVASSDRSEKEPRMITSVPNHRRTPTVAVLAALIILVSACTG